ncbi:MAG: hypothetical protein QXX40_06405 [Sulfolobales archaeon]
MESVEVNTQNLARLALELPDRVLVVDRLTGELIDVLGDRLEANKSIAKAVAIAVASLSALEDVVGGEILKLEVEYSAGHAVAQVDGNIVKVSVRSW